MKIQLKSSEIQFHQNHNYQISLTNNLVFDTLLMGVPLKLLEVTISEGLNHRGNAATNLLPLVSPYRLKIERGKGIFLRMSTAACIFEGESRLEMAQLEYILSATELIR